VSWEDAYTAFCKTKKKEEEEEEEEEEEVKET